MNEKENRKSGFIREIIGCFISPRSSFKSILKKASLKKATALILVIAIVAALASFNYMSKLPQTSFPEQGPSGPIPGQGTPITAEQFRQVLGIMGAMTALIGVFATWLISSALIHGFSKTLRGKGSFRNMLTVAGYASVPFLIQQILRLADSFMVSEEALQLATSLQMSVIAEAAVGIFTIFGIWSMILLIIAARENYKISTAKSTAATILSFIVLIFISAFLPFM
jgi:hypothetical protein